MAKSQISKTIITKCHGRVSSPIVMFVLPWQSSFAAAVGQARGVDKRLLEPLACREPLAWKEPVYWKEELLPHLVPNLHDKLIMGRGFFLQGLTCCLELQSVCQLGPSVLPFWAVDSG